MNAELPGHAQVVIVGGGIAGSSLAYHLTKLGVTDVVMLERHTLTSGTTWHAAGLIMQLRSSHAMTELTRYNVELYSSLEAETGQATGFKQNGTLGIARNAERMHETRHLATVAKSFGIEAHMIGPAEAVELYPGIDVSLVEGAIYIPKDGQTNPVDTTMSLIAGAKQRGAAVFEHSPVETLARLPSGEYWVTTPGGKELSICELAQRKRKGHWSQKNNASRGSKQKIKRVQVQQNCLGKNEQKKPPRGCR